MKKSKKTKLITSLSSVAVVATVTPLAATGFSLDNKKDKKNKTTSLTSTNDTTYKMSDIGWVTRSNTTTNNKDTIKATVISDNNVNFTKYRKLKSNIEIKVEDGEAANTFKVTISAKQGSSYISGDDVVWTMNYIAPSPTPSADISINASSIKRTIDYYAAEADRTFKLEAVQGTEQITLTSANCTITSSDTTVLTVSTYDTTNGFTITPVNKGLASVKIVITGTGGAVGSTEVPVLINLSDVVTADYATIKGYATNKKLIVGQKYRINDYVATVPEDAEALDGITTAKNAFDIIVSASATDTFFEDAKAVKHGDGTGYFASANLDAWQIKYDINNDATKYEWADTALTETVPNGKGVIYFMRDEFANEAPYDFKSIQFDGKYTFANGTADASLTNKVSSNTILAYTLDGKQMLNNITFNVGDTTCYNNHFGLGCSDITLGNDAVNNNFGSNCFDITLSDGSSLNTFGSNCNTIKVNQAETPVKNAFVGNIIGNDCTELTFNIGNEGGKAPKYVLYNTFDQGVTEVTIEKVDFMRNTLLSSVANAEFTEDTYNKTLSSGPTPTPVYEVTAKLNDVAISDGFSVGVKENDRITFTCAGETAAQSWKEVNGTSLSTYASWGTTWKNILTFNSNVSTLTEEKEFTIQACSDTEGATPIEGAKFTLKITNGLITVTADSTSLTNCSWEAATQAVAGGFIGTLSFNEASKTAEASGLKLSTTAAQNPRYEFYVSSTPLSTYGVSYDATKGLTFPAGVSDNFGPNTQIKVMVYEGETDELKGSVYFRAYPSTPSTYKQLGSLAAGQNVTVDANNDITYTIPEPEAENRSGKFTLQSAEDIEPYSEGGKIYIYALREDGSVDNKITCTLGEDKRTITCEISPDHPIIETASRISIYISGSKAQYAYYRASKLKVVGLPEMTFPTQDITTGTTNCSWHYGRIARAAWISQGQLKITSYNQEAVANGVTLTPPTGVTISSYKFYKIAWDSGISGYKYTETTDITYDATDNIKVAANFMQSASILNICVVGYDTNNNAVAEAFFDVTR